MSADVRSFTADLMIAPGSGLPPLSLSALDPTGYVQDAFDARAGKVPAEMASAVTTGGDITGSGLHLGLGLPTIEQIKGAFKGALVVLVMVVLGLLLVTFGTLQLTKD